MKPIEPGTLQNEVPPRPDQSWPAVLVAVLVVLGGFWIMYGTSRPEPRRGEGTFHPLPSPNTSGGMSVTEALGHRRSIREFTAKPLAPEQVAQLCWAGQGITDQATGFRTAPSAGGLYPLTVFVVDANRVSEYEPRSHALREIQAGDHRRELRAAAHDQRWVGAAPVCLVLVMDVRRTAAKYGRRAERYCLLEAGHAAQNILLQATALGLGGVPVGAFEDDPVARLLRLSGEARPVYLLPVGYPAGH